MSNFVKQAGPAAWAAQAGKTLLNVPFAKTLLGGSAALSAIPLAERYQSLSDNDALDLKIKQLNKGTRPPENPLLPTSSALQAPPKDLDVSDIRSAPSDPSLAGEATLAAGDNPNDLVEARPYSGYVPAGMPHPGRYLDTPAPPEPEPGLPWDKIGYGAAGAGLGALAGAALPGDHKKLKALLGGGLGLGGGLMLANYLAKKSSAEEMSKAAGLGSLLRAIPVTAEQVRTGIGIGTAGFLGGHYLGGRNGSRALETASEAQRQFDEYKAKTQGLRDNLDNIIAGSREARKLLGQAKIERDQNRSTIKDLNQRLEAAGSDRAAATAALEAAEQRAAGRKKDLDSQFNWGRAARYVSGGLLGGLVGSEIGELIGKDKKNEGLRSAIGGVIGTGVGLGGAALVPYAREYLAKRSDENFVGPIEQPQWVNDSKEWADWGNARKLVNSRQQSGLPGTSGSGAGGDIRGMMRAGMNHLGGSVDRFKHHAALGTAAGAAGNAIRYGGMGLGGAALGYGLGSLAGGETEEEKKRKRRMAALLGGGVGLAGAAVLPSLLKRSAFQRKESSLLGAAAKGLIRSPYVKVPAITGATLGTGGLALNHTVGDKLDEISRNRTRQVTGTIADVTKQINNNLNDVKEQVKEFDNTVNNRAMDISGLVGTADTKLSEIQNFLEEKGKLKELGMDLGSGLGKGLQQGATSAYTNPATIMSVGGLGLLGAALGSTIPDKRKGLGAIVGGVGGAGAGLLLLQALKNPEIAARLHLLHGKV